MASDEEAEKVIVAFQDQYEAATGGEATGKGDAAAQKGGSSKPAKAKDLKGSTRFTICTSFGMGLKVRLGLKTVLHVGVLRPTPLC